MLNSLRAWELGCQVAWHAMCNVSLFSCFYMVLPCFFCFFSAELLGKNSVVPLRLQAWVFLLGSLGMFWDWLLVLLILGIFSGSLKRLSFSSRYPPGHLERVKLPSSLEHLALGNCFVSIWSATCRRAGPFHTVKSWWKVFFLELLVDTDESNQEGDAWCRTTV